METSTLNSTPEKVLQMPLEKFFSIEVMDEVVSGWNAGTSWKPQFRIGPQFLKRLHAHAAEKGLQMETVGDFLNAYSEDDLVRLKFVSIATLAQLNELLASFGLTFHRGRAQE